MMTLEPFRIEETHGILRRPENEIQISSDDFAWTSLYASAQKEHPYEGVFAPVRDHLIVLHRDGPVTIDTTRGPVRFRRAVPPGGIHLVPGDMEFGVRLSGELNTLHVYVRRAIIEEVAADMVEGDPSRIEIPPQILDSDPELKMLLQSVHLALGNGTVSTAFYIDYLSRAIAALLVRSHSGARIRTRPSPGSRTGIGPTIAEAVDYMRANLDRSINLSDIAQAVNRSPSHFARQFRQDLGVAPHQYLIGLRIQKAQTLLARTDMPIAEIALDCGFCHQEHLTRVFRARCKTTPAAYRKAKRH